MKQILPLLFFGLIACLSAQTPALSLVVTSVGSDLSPTIFAAACVDPQHVALSWAIDYGDSSVQQGSGCPPSVLSHQYAHAQTYSPLLTVQYAPAITATTTVVILHMAATHAYFDQWAADPRCHGLSLRDDVQLAVMAKAWNPNLSSAAPGWLYDPTIDAAQGTVLSHYPADGSISPQLRVNDLTTTGILTYVWETRIPASWADDPISYVAPDSGITRPGSSVPSKSFQTASNDYSSGIFVETRLFAVHPTLPDIANVDWRIYNVNNVNMLGPGVSRAKGTTGNNSDTIQPLLIKYFLQADTWTRLIQQTEFATDVINGTIYDRWSLWAADQPRGIVQLYDRLLIRAQQAGIRGFWFEYNESQQRAPGIPAESVFNRNWLQCHDVPLGDLLVAPGS